MEKPQENTAARESELNDWLFFEAAYGQNGQFIGLRLTAKNTGQQSLSKTSIVLFYAEDTCLRGFRAGEKFVPGLNEEIEYKPVYLDFGK